MVDRDGNIDSNVGLRSPNKPDDVQLLTPSGQWLLVQARRIEPATRPTARGGTQDGHVTVIRTVNGVAEGGYRDSSGDPQALCSWLSSTTYSTYTQPPDDKLTSHEKGVFFVQVNVRPWFLRFAAAREPVRRLTARLFPIQDRGFKPVTGLGAFNRVHH
jgi:hypothetical protein